MRRAVEALEAQWQVEQGQKCPRLMQHNADAVLPALAVGCSFWEESEAKPRRD